MANPHDAEGRQQGRWRFSRFDGRFVFDYADGRKGFASPTFMEPEQFAEFVNTSLAGAQDVIAALEARLNAAETGRREAEAEVTRLRARTHEIQERADKEIGPLRKFKQGTIERTIPFLRRHAWHPDDGSKNARYWYGWLWEQAVKRAERAEAKGALAAWVRGQQGKGLRDTEILTRFADAYDALITQEVTDD